MCELGWKSLGILELSAAGTAMREPRKAAHNDGEKAVSPQPLSSPQFDDTASHFPREARGGDARH